MGMKAIFSATLVLAAVTFCSAATNDPTAILQQGLFEEEANHNLAAAMQAYETVVNQFDQNRKLAATAVFRLGECYRRQGYTNEASAQYERVLREFADQTPLATLSRQNLIALGVSLPSASGGALPNAAARQEQKRLLEEEVKLVEKKLAALQKQREVGAIAEGEVWSTQRDLLQLKQKIAALDAGAPMLQDLNVSAIAPTSTEAEEVRRIEAMIKDSPDLINAKDNNGNTPLHTAAMKGEAVVVKFLLENGADVDARDINGQTPLYDASLNGHKSVVDLLIQSHANVGAASWRSDTPLHAAAGKGFRSVVELLLAKGAEVNAKTKEGTTPLHAAVVNGFKTIADLLLAHGADVNAITTDARANGGQRFTGTPLHITAQTGDEGMASVLLEHKANLELYNEVTQTPLDVAAQTSRIEIAKLFLEHGAKVNPPDPHGWTPLYYALISRHEEMAALLLTNGADPNVKFEYSLNPRPGTGFPPGSNLVKKDYTPLLLATYLGNPNLVQLLLSNKADPNMKSAEGDTPLFNGLTYGTPTLKRQMVLPLVAKGADVDIRDTQGMTPLMRAVQMGDNELVELFLAHKANVNAQDKRGWSALHYAAEFSTQGNAVPLAQDLLAAGAKVNARESDGRTPLNIALLPRSSFAPTQSELAEFLRHHGAAEYVPNPKGIEIRRGQSYSSLVFSKDTNNWNQFTILDLLGVQLGLLAASPAGEVRAKESPDLGFVNGIYGPGHILANPDFSHIRIRRPAKNPQGWEDTTVDVESLLKSGDCSKNVPLGWGDIVEIPQMDRPRNDDWRGFNRGEFNNLAKCLSRQVTFILGNQTTNVTLSIEVVQFGNIVTKEPFWIKPVLTAVLRGLPDEQTDQLDRSKVRITRQDPANGQKLEWVVDCSAYLAPDVWLRDGDVVEVRDRP
jgi:cytohesin